MSRARVALACAAIAAFDLWLVFPDEIVARANPYDQQRFAEMIRELAAGHWLGAYDPLTLVREPMYPVFAAAVRATGVPLRLATEMLLLAGAGLLAAALLRAGAGGWVVVASYAALVLQPHSLLANRELLPAGLYGAVLPAAVAGLVLALASPRLRGCAGHALWAGLAGGVLWAARPERPLVLLPVAVAGVLAAFTSSGRRAQARGAAWRGAAARAATLAGVAAAGIAAVEGAFALANGIHYGVYAGTELEAPGYLAANRALTGIVQDEPRRFVPVPEESRRRAYRVSPAFRSLRPVLEGPSWARSVSCRIDRVCDDVAAGYFRWLFREAVARAGHAGSPAEKEAFFRRIADEIRAGCARGDIACRSGTHPFLHPAPRTWLSHVPGSLVRLAQRAAALGGPRDWDPPGDDPATPRAFRTLVDEVASRRDELASNGQVVLEGWAASEGAPLQRISVWSGRQRIASADVPAGGGRRVGFRLAFEKTAPTLFAMAPVLALERAGGDAARIPLAAARAGPDAVVEQDGVRLAIERFDETGGSDPLRRRVRTALWIGNALALRAAATLALVALPIAAWPSRRRPARARGQDELVWCAIVLLGAVVVARVALLAVIDASSFPARSSRYLHPIVGLVWVVLLLVVERGARRWRVRPTTEGEA